jgi:hypothetical protein
LRSPASPDEIIIGEGALVEARMLLGVALVTSQPEVIEHLTRAVLAKSSGVLEAQPP